MFIIRLLCGFIFKIVLAESEFHICYKGVCMCGVHACMVWNFMYISFFPLVLLFWVTFVGHPDLLAHLVCWGQSKIWLTKGSRGPHWAATSAEVTPVCSVLEVFFSWYLGFNSPKAESKTRLGPSSLSGKAWRIITEENEEAQAAGLLMLLV